MTELTIKEFGSIEQFHKLAKVHGLGAPITSYELLRKPRPRIFFEAAIVHLRKFMYSDKREEFVQTIAAVLAASGLPENIGKLERAEKMNAKNGAISPQKLMLLMGLLGISPLKYKTYD